MCVFTRARYQLLGSSSFSMLQTFPSSSSFSLLLSSSSSSLDEDSFSSSALRQTDRQTDSEYSCNWRDGYRAITSYIRSITLRLTVDSFQHGYSSPPSLPEQTIHPHTHAFFCVLSKLWTNCTLTTLFLKFFVSIKFFESNIPVYSEQEVTQSHVDISFILNSELNPFTSCCELTTVQSQHKH